MLFGSILSTFLWLGELVKTAFSLQSQLDSAGPGPSQNLIFSMFFWGIGFRCVFRTPFFRLLSIFGSIWRSPFWHIFAAILCLGSTLNNEAIFWQVPWSSKTCKFLVQFHHASSPASGGRRILLSFAPSAAAVWHCDRIRIRCKYTYVWQTVIFKHWSLPFINEHLFWLICRPSNNSSKCCDRLVRDQIMSQPKSLRLHFVGGYFSCGVSLFSALFCCTAPSSLSSHMFKITGRNARPFFSGFRGYDAPGFSHQKCVKNKTKCSPFFAWRNKCSIYVCCTVSSVFSPKMLTEQGEMPALFIWKI